MKGRGPSQGMIVIVFVDSIEEAYILDSGSYRCGYRTWGANTNL